MSIIRFYNKLGRFCFEAALLGVLTLWFYMGFYTAKAFPENFETIHNASYSGFVMNDKDWFVYSAAVRSVFTGIHQTGWQLRAMAGKGRYHYRQDKTFYQGDMTSQEVMIGYQFVKRPFFVKLYGGPVMETHTIQPDNPLSDAVGRHIGAKLQFESWMDWGEKGFATLDFTYSTLQNSYELSGKAGMKVFAGLQLGFEAGLSGNDVLDRRYGGLIGTYQLTKTKALSLVAGGGQNEGADDIGLYTKIKFDLKF